MARRYFAIGQLLESCALTEDAYKTLHIEVDKQTNTISYHPTVSYFAPVKAGEGEVRIKRLEPTGC